MCAVVGAVVIGFYVVAECMRFRDNMRPYTEFEITRRRFMYLEVSSLNRPILNELDFLEVFSRPLFQYVVVTSVKPPSKTKCCICDKPRNGMFCTTCKRKWVCHQCSQRMVYYNHKHITWPCCNTPRTMGTTFECIILRWREWVEQTNQNVEQLSYEDAVDSISKFGRLVQQRSFNAAYRHIHYTN